MAGNSKRKTLALHVLFGTRNHCLQPPTIDAKLLGSQAEGEVSVTQEVAFGCQTGGFGTGLAYHNRVSVANQLPWEKAKGFS